MDHSIPHSQFLEWDPEDRDKVIAYLMEEADRCSQCGTKASEWAEDRFAYVAEGHWCQGCYNIDAENEVLRGGPNGRTMPGTTVKLVLNTAQKRAELAEMARRWRERKTEDQE